MMKTMRKSIIIDFFIFFIMYWYNLQGWVCNFNIRLILAVFLQIISYLNWIKCSVSALPLHVNCMTILDGLSLISSLFYNHWIFLSLTFTVTWIFVEDQCALKSGVLVGRVRRVGVFYFGTGRVGFLPKNSGTGTGRDGLWENFKGKSTYTGPLFFIIDIITITFLWNHDMMVEIHFKL